MGWGRQDKLPWAIVFCIDSSTIVFPMFSADILVNCVIGFFCAHSPLRSAVTNLLFPVLSLVGCCVFSKWQDTFFVVSV